MFWSSLFCSFVVCGIVLEIGGKGGIVGGVGYVTNTALAHFMISSREFNVICFFIMAVVILIIVCMFEKG